MATRSYIAKRLPNGDIRAIYCHWDGYPEHNGRILVQNYTDEDKIDALLALGALSVLGAEIGEKQDFNKPTEGWCLAYRRDRGEKLQGPGLYSHVRELTGDADYVYIWENNGWTCFNDRKQIELAFEAA